MDTSKLHKVNGMAAVDDALEDRVDRCGAGEIRARACVR